METEQTGLKRILGVPPAQLLGVVAGSLALYWGIVWWVDHGSASSDQPAKTAQAPGGTQASLSSAAFAPPPESAIPKGPYGDAIRRGEQIFRKTQTYAKQYAGSGLNCTNCHLDGGRQPDAAPMWAAWVSYPAWRDKNKQINTMEDRIHGCFVYSMNAQASPAGHAPPPGSDIYRDLQAYFAWLATGAPVGKHMAGRGYPKLPKPAQGFDPQRGAQVFADHCASCHGSDGQGAKNADGRYAYPPLWGEHSYNWGAGMARLANAAGFIKANMPFGMGNTLSDQQAWDVAAFVDSHERPRDPRQKGTTIAATRAAHHDNGDYYGQVINGDLLGDGISGKKSAR